MENVKDKNITELISVFPEPVLLVSNKSGNFFVDAEYGDTGKALYDGLNINEPLPVFEVIKKGYGESKKWGHSDLNRFLQSIIDRQKPDTSKIIAIQKSSDSENKFLQLRGTPVTVEKGNDRQVFLMIRDVTSAVCFGMENAGINSREYR